MYETNKLAKYLEDYEIANLIALIFGEVTQHNILETNKLRSEDMVENEMINYYLN